MKLLTCGFNGCVYDNGDTIVKKANGPLSKAKKEIAFMTWFSGLRKSTRESLCLIELLDYGEQLGLTRIPKPPGFEKWPEKYVELWRKVNERSTRHHELVYPKLEYTLRDRYWNVSRPERYRMAIDFLRTAKYMTAHGWYNSDVHSQNIMYGHGRWYMIDYGAVRTTGDLAHSILAVLATLSCVPEFSVFPDDHKPTYDEPKKTKKT